MSSKQELSWSQIAKSYDLSEAEFFKRVVDYLCGERIRVSIDSAQRVLNKTENRGARVIFAVLEENGRYKILPNIEDWRKIDFSVLWIDAFTVSNHSSTCLLIDKSSQFAREARISKGMILDAEEISVIQRQEDDLAHLVWSVREEIEKQEFIRLSAIYQKSKSTLDEEESEYWARRLAYDYAVEELGIAEDFEYNEWFKDYYSYEFTSSYDKVLDKLYNSFNIKKVYVYDGDYWGDDEYVPDYPSASEQRSQWEDTYGEY